MSRHPRAGRAACLAGTTFVGLVILAGCGRVGFSEPCRGVDCSGHGVCVVVDDLPACECDPGYHAAQLDCVPDAIACTADSDCDDDEPCTDDTCGPTGSCLNTPNRAPCDDGLVCTRDDACDGAGACAGAPVDCSHLDAECLRGVCDEASGGCQARPVADATECGQRTCDGLRWSRMTCLAGACAGSEAVQDCDDGDACTADGCDPAAGCDHQPEADGSPCGPPACDGLDWVDPVCQAGACTGRMVVESCDDGRVCTIDVCDAVDGCSHAFNTAPCDDGDACTMDDACAAGVCGGVPLDADADGAVAQACGGVDCDDGDPNIGPQVFEGPMGDPACADGLDNDCDGLTDGGDSGCAQCNQNADCDDADACNGAEVCTAGACQPGTPLSCDDGLFCNGPESCDPQAGCQTGQPPCPGGECNTCQEATDSCFDPAGTACTDDGLFCDGPERCDGAGACTGAGDPCQGSECNTCQEATDSCFDPAGTACTDDGLFCDGPERCDGAGACAATGDPCPPGDACNQCDEAGDDCTSPAGAACDDGQACTYSDACDGAGGCGGVPVQCGCYADQCNSAACNPGTGLCEVTPSPIGTACSPDGGKQFMYCQAGICTHWCNDSSELPGESDHECPAGYMCALYSDTDSAGYCAPSSGARVIGETCTNDSQCRSQYCDNAYNPKLCAGACSSTSDCRGINAYTADWSCQAFEFGSGSYTHGFCNPEPGSGTTGDACATSSDCRDRYCPSGSPRVCRDLCCTEADCPAPYACWFEAGTGSSYLKACTDLGPLGAGAFGDPCSPTGFVDTACASGLCYNMGDGQDRCSRFCCRDGDCPAGYICEFSVAAGGFEDVRACRLPFESCCPNTPADQVEAADAGNNAVYWVWGPIQIVPGPGSPEATGLVLSPGMVFTIEGTGRDNNDYGPNSEYLDVDSFAFNSGSAADIHLVLDVAGTSADLDVIITDASLTHVAGPGLIGDGSANFFDGFFEEDFMADEQGLYQPGTDYVVTVGVYTGAGGLPVDWQLTLCAR